MKRIILSFALLYALNTNAQVAVGATTADASAALDVVSTTKGFLPPRMTAAQRTAIGSPATGLMVFQTDGTAGLYYYSGSAWIYIINNGAAMPIGGGGTGATTAAGARAALGAAASGSNTDITSLAPASAGTINNMAIGGTTPAAGAFTSASTTGNLAVGGKLVSATGNTSGVRVTNSSGDVTIDGKLTLGSPNTAPANAANAGLAILNGSNELQKRPLALTIVRRANGSDQSGFTAMQFNDVLFNEEVVDLGNNYNPVTGVFTCPRTGYYQLTLNVTTLNTGEDSQLSIDVGDNTKNLRGYIPMSSINVGQGTLTGIVYLTAGTSLKPQIYVRSNGLIIGAKQYSNMYINELPQ